MVTPSGVIVLTDRRLAAGPLVEVVRAAVRGGASWVVLRDRDLPYAERAALAAELRTVARVIVAGPDPLGGDAVHLSAVDNRPRGVALVGRSWHGSEQLSDEDYVTLSPIFPTATKPGYGPALGASRAARLAAGLEGLGVAGPGASGVAGPRASGVAGPGDSGAAGRPWLALGGVDSPERAAECVRAGAAGVAVLGAIMRAGDPERVTRALAEAVA
ncbi:thiamine phosphate synthase [Pseudosporangium ferrugineum]|uniref:Thiamine-phosphate pyrophosphorylase n=1 Tax=Pseudosporangium ferrugineum TaxID=439699 RepID=A0A2T0RGN4_9ACTN|nr:thiamine phosphate synthase [Pseudosporangium ferrugineum]PRY20328.1 thiamine-phosphate pyrophosphorylase [Pseudosporangium ferrugineum]